MGAPSVFKPFYRNPISGLPTAIPNGAILNIGGTTHSTFTVDGKGVMLSDGSTSDGNPTAIWNLQTAYTNTNDGFGFASITMDPGRDFIIYDDNNPLVFFKIDSTTGKVTISGDLEVNGTSTVINSSITDYDHILLSPANGATQALSIEPDVSVTPTADLINVKDQFNGTNIFSVNAIVGTQIQDLSVQNNIALSGLLNGIDIVALDNTLQSHIFISNNKHQAQEINLTVGSLTPFNVPLSVTEVQKAIEYLADKVDTLNNAVQQNYGFTYLETIGAATWTIVHNMGTQNFVHSLFDGNGEQIIPDKFKIINDNQVQIQFTAAITGRCNFMFYI